MADIRPFHGIHYNPALVKDLAKVICPPYDVISPQLQRQMYQSSEFNFVRIEFGRELPQDKNTYNKYTRASVALEKWLEQGILTADERPSIYIDDHHFHFHGKKYCRRAIICLVRLEEWDSMIVRPHEGTLSRPKGDRLNLLWTLQSNTSPVMALYEDTKKRISALLDDQAHGKALLSADNDGDRHCLWSVTDSGIIRQVHDLLVDQPLYIADGHHRYESALAYRRGRRTYYRCLTENEPFDFVMMALVDFTDPGLIILPAHRLVRGLSPSALERLPAGLETCFKVEEHPLKSDDIIQRLEGLLSGSSGAVQLVIYGLKKDGLLRLTVRDFNIIRPMIPYFHSELYHRLDVSIVDHVILEELLGLSPDMTGSIVDYVNDAQEAISRVRENEYQLAVMVNPVKPGTIKAIADSGDRMPRKSTYFYPKMPSGLVLYSFT